MTIRELAPGDAATAAALTPGWSEADYLAIARGDSPSRLGLVIGEVEALLLASCIPPEAEILNLYVRSDLRRRGLGTALLQAVLDRLKASGVERCWLEVRESNAPALSIYGAQGFLPTGRRKDYYREPREDALVLEKKLSIVS